MPTGRQGFTAKITDKTLLRVVLDAISSFSNPLEVTQKQADSAIRDMDLVGVPGVNVAVRRLQKTRPGLVWDDLRRMAIGHRPRGRDVRDRLPGRDAAIAATIRTLATDLPTPTAGHVTRALLAASLLAEGEPLWMHTYREVREPWMPTLSQVLTSLHGRGLSWRAGLAAAGLNAATAYGGPAGMPLDQAVELFAADTGKLPVGLDIPRWARQRGVRLGRSGSVTAQDLADANARLCRAREEAGLDRLSPHEVTADLTALEPYPAEHPYSRSRGAVTPEEIIEGLVIALGRLGSGEQLTEHVLTRLWKEDRSIPDPVRVRLIGAAYRVSNPLTTMRQEAADRRLGRPPHQVGDTESQIEERVRAYLGAATKWPASARWESDGQRALYWATRDRGTRWWCARLGVAPPRGRRDDADVLAAMARFIGAKSTMPRRAEWVAADLGHLYDTAANRRGIAWYAHHLGVTYVPPPTALGIDRSRRRRRHTDESIAADLLACAGGPGGKLPSLKQLRQDGHTGLAMAISRHELGLVGWGDKLGLIVSDRQRSHSERRRVRPRAS